MNEMKPCPFCGAKVKAIYPYMLYVESHKLWNFNHHCVVDNLDCLGVCIDVYGSTEEKVIERWNNRA